MAKIMEENTEHKHRLAKECAEEISRLHSALKRRDEEMEDLRNRNESLERRLSTMEKDLKRATDDELRFCVPGCPSRSGDRCTKFDIDVFACGGAPPNISEMERKPSKFEKTIAFLEANKVLIDDKFHDVNTSMFPSPPGGKTPREIQEHAVYVGPAPGIDEASANSKNKPLIDREFTSVAVADGKVGMRDTYKTGEFEKKRAMVIDSERKMACDERGGKNRKEHFKKSMGMLRRRGR